ncbi:glycosyltransferase, partial [Flavihumibacter sp. CACIAM 22H1]|uniref:glycosyltransferase n=1 Tax=Flavihumibacter sp. CACIAM 22H1 TaxID=1812911 RepID=UPI0025BDE707
LSAYYSDSSIFVIPSRSEGFPNALIEAMAAGLPPVSYNFIGGPEEIIEPGKNGFLVEEGDIKGLAHAINKLASDKELRISIGNAAKQARFVYSNERITKRIAQFLGV